MADQSLVEGIKKHLAQGDSPEVVKQHVLKAGYSMYEFEAALREAQIAPARNTSFIQPHSDQPAIASDTNITPQAQTQAVGEVASATVPQNLGGTWKLVALILLAAVVLFVLVMLIPVVTESIKYAKNKGADEATQQNMAKARSIVELYGSQPDDTTDYSGFCETSDFRDLSLDGQLDLACITTADTYIIEAKLSDGQFVCADNNFLGTLPVSSFDYGACLEETEITACTIDSEEVMLAEQKLAETEKQRNEIKSKIEMLLEYDDEYYQLSDEIDQLSERWYEDYEAFVDASLATQGESIFDDIHQKYCTGEPLITVSTPINGDIEFMTKLGEAVPGEQLCELNTEIMPEAEVPETLSRAADLAIHKDKTQSAIDLYHCAAEKYYSPSAMLRLAQLYWYGTDVVLESAVNGDHKHVEPDINKGYYWMTAHYWTAIELSSPYADQGMTQYGWNSLGLLDRMQHDQNLLTDDMIRLEEDAILFLSKKFPQVLNEEARLFYHSMRAMSDALDHAATTGDTSGLIIESFSSDTPQTSGESYREFAENVVIATSINAENFYGVRETFSGYCESDEIYSVLEMNDPDALVDINCWTDNDSYVLFAPVSENLYVCTDNFNSIVALSSPPQTLSCR